MASGKLKNSIIKAVALLIALIFGLVLYYKVTTTNMISDMMNVFEEKEGAGFSVQKKYSEEQRDSIYQIIKGFWECDEYSDNGFKYQGRLEVVPNGYVWLVESVKGVLPSGDSTDLVHVLNGFIYPSSAGGEGANTVSVVFRNLTQLWIDNGDTCKITKYYGIGSNSETGGAMLDKMDVVVSEFMDVPDELDLSKGLLGFLNRSYKRYNNSDVSTFFPEGIIDYVYNLSGTDVNIDKKQYSVKKGQITVNKENASKIALDPFTLKECKDCKDLSDFLRKRVSEDIRKNVETKRDESRIVDIIKRYYEPLSLDNAVDFTLYQNEKKHVLVKIKFDIDKTGTVQNAGVNIGVNNIGKKVLENTMIREIEKWKFAEVNTVEELFKVEYADTLRY